MEFHYNDGGRAAAGYRGKARDCACRAIAIAAEIPYAEAYSLINAKGKQDRCSKRRNGKSSAGTGVFKPTMHRIMESLGWVWEPCMEIGSGCKIHLRAEELPRGRIIVSLSRHFAAVIDGVIHDTHDCSRDGTRCVYGFYFKPITDKVEG